MMILKILLNTQMTCNMLIKLLNNTILEKKSKLIIVFDHMIADMIINKQVNPIVTEMFIRGRKLNISIDFITQ